MKDIQSLRDSRRIGIRKVGVKTISYPITVLDKARKLQRTVATVNMYVNLPHQFKGTHMSRFVEILNEFHGEITVRNFRSILETMKERLDAEAAHMEMHFPYFMPCEASPGRFGMERYQCSMHGSLQKVDDLVITVAVPVSFSDGCGRWGSATVAVRLARFLWMEDLIGMIRQALAPCGTRDSVESISLLLGAMLQHHPAISWFHVVTEHWTDGYDLVASTCSASSVTVS